MKYEFLLDDLQETQKAIGTDKGLAKIGDGIVNFTYSVAKSIYLTKNIDKRTIIRTGTKVSKRILSTSLKEADMKDFAKNRGDAHDLADTVEAIFAYVWLNNHITINGIIDFFAEHLKGDLLDRTGEIEAAIRIFTSFLKSIKKYLPTKVI